MDMLNKLQIFLDDKKLHKKYFYCGLIFSWILKHYKDPEYNLKIQNFLNAEILPEIFLKILYEISTLKNKNLRVADIINHMNTWLKNSSYYGIQYAILINIDREYYQIPICNDDNLELLSRFLITDYPITKNLYDNIIFNKDNKDLSKLCMCFVYLELIEDTIKLFDVSDGQINMEIDLLTFRKILNNFNKLYNNGNIIIIEKNNNDYDVFPLSS